MPIINDKKVFVCSRALPRSIDRAEAQLRTLIINSNVDNIKSLRLERSGRKQSRATPEIASYHRNDYFSLSVNKDGEIWKKLASS